MSWIKPNFLWMIFRSGWATKENQERVLAMFLRREAFDILMPKPTGSGRWPRPTCACNGTRTTTPAAAK